MMAGAAPSSNDDGSLRITSRLVIPSDEVRLRVTTSGGPGGQHANRSLTKVVASFDVAASNSLSASQRELLESRAGSVVQSSASRYRSQAQNRTAALDQLAAKIAGGIARATPRRATKPTKGSRVRRADDKRARAKLKQQRRRVGDD